MTLSDEQVAILNEFRRVQIQNHRNFTGWYSQLGPQGQSVIDQILQDDVTPELISLADACSQEEWDSTLFLRVIAGGNPDPEVTLILTNVSLDHILAEVRDFLNDRI